MKLAEGGKIEVEVLDIGKFGERVPVREVKTGEAERADVIK